MITFDYLLEIPMDVTLGASMVEDIEDYVEAFVRFGVSNRHYLALRGSV